MHWSEVWYGKGAGPVALRAALVPGSWLYAAGWTCYAGLYRAGLKKAKEPHCPVICVGNLQVGGTGKTPVTLHVAEVLGSLGRRVAISCSGYGAPRSESATLAPDGELNALEWGDEPAMIRMLLPNVPLIVGRDRVQAARNCHEALPDHVLLLDDGFQHLPMRKHLSIILDPDRGNRFCLPAGPYREPRSGLSRADLVLPGRFLVEREMVLDRAVSGRVNVLCALADPSGFVSGLGLEVGLREFLPDHDTLQSAGLLDRFPPGEPLVCTAKDWVKLRLRGDLAGRTVVVANVLARIEPAAEFREWLVTNLSDGGTRSV